MAWLDWALLNSTGAPQPGQGTGQGGRIAYEAKELAPMLMDDAWLDSFAPGTVGAAYRDFVRSEQLSAEGLAEISRTGIPEQVTLSMQVLPETGLILPGKFVRFAGVTGLVRGTSVTWQRLQGFLKTASGIIVATVCAVWLLQAIPTSTGEAFGEATPLFGRRSDGRRPLDAFLWSLVFSTFEHAVLANVADIEFVLQAIPNFTRLPEVPSVFLKLSLSCLQQPQSVSALLRMFDMT